MTDRDQVFAEFALRQFVHGWSADAAHWQVDAMADEILRLRAILTMLRKPDLDVLASAMTAWSRTGEVPAMLHAALTTAEREVANDEG